MNLSNEVKHTRISDELFSKEKIKSWRIYYSDYSWCNGKNYHANIEFINGDFKGEKSFKASSFKEVVEMMDNFIKNI